MSLQVKTVYLRGAFDADDLSLIHSALRLIEQNKQDQLFTIKIAVTSREMQEAYEAIRGIAGDPAGRSVVIGRLARGEL